MCFWLKKCKKCPALAVKKAKNGGFLRFFECFWFRWGVFLVFFDGVGGRHCACLLIWGNAPCRMLMCLINV